MVSNLPKNVQFLSYFTLGYGFSYQWVDCDDYSNKAFRLCSREPIGCASTTVPPTGKRRKRRVDEEHKPGKYGRKSTNNGTRLPFT